MAKPKKLTKDQRALVRQRHKSSLERARNKRAEEGKMYAVGGGVVASVVSAAPFFRKQGDNKIGLGGITVRMAAALAFLGLGFYDESEIGDGLVGAGIAFGSSTLTSYAASMMPEEDEG